MAEATPPPMAPTSCRITLDPVLETLPPPPERQGCHDEIMSDQVDQPTMASVTTEILSDMKIEPYMCGEDTMYELQMQQEAEKKGPGSGESWEAEEGLQEHMKESESTMRAGATSSPASDGGQRGRDSVIKKTTPPLQASAPPPPSPAPPPPSPFRPTAGLPQMPKLIIRTDIIQAEGVSEQKLGGNPATKLLGDSPASPSLGGGYTSDEYRPCLFNVLEESNWGRCPLCPETRSGPFGMRIHLICHSEIDAAISKTIEDQPLYTCSNKLSKACKTGWANKRSFICHQYIHCGKKALRKFDGFLKSFTKQCIMNAELNAPSPPVSPPSQMTNMTSFTGATTSKANCDQICVLCGWTFPPTSLFEHLLTRHRVNLHAGVSICSENLISNYPTF